MLNAMSQGNDGSMCTLHANSSSGAFGKIAMYAIQSPERLPLDATNLLIANSIDLVVYIGRGVQGGAGTGVRYVSSIREVAGADGTMISSNEIFAPGPDRRAVPASPMQNRNLDDLVAAGFDPNVMNRPGGWWT
jgi:Flp pilus assembly CpaF family ATPase